MIPTARKPARSPDARRPSHDGLFWPRPRHEMTDESSIRTRMVEDAARFRHERGEGGEINEADFRRLGWREPHIKEFGAEAMASALASFEQRAA